MKDDNKNISSNKGWLQRLLNRNNDEKKIAKDPLEESLSKSNATHESYRSSVSTNSTPSNLEAKGKYSERYIIAQETQDDALKALGGM